MTRYGCIPATPDPRDYRFKAPTPYTGAFVDLTAGFPQDPYDQGQLGSCVANGTGAAVDFARVKHGLPPMAPPSRLFIYWQGRKRAGYPLGEDTGLQIRDGFTVISKDGAPPETDWPYEINRFTVQPPPAAYADASHDVAAVFGSVTVDDIDATIASGYPVVFGFDVPESFEGPDIAATGVMQVPVPGERSVGGHCVVAVSTMKDGSEIPHGTPGVKYRKCRNSWGTSWGAGGYFWMPVHVMASRGSDFWMVTTMTDPHAPTPPGPVVPPFPVAWAWLSRLLQRIVTWLGSWATTGTGASGTSRPS